MVHVASTISQLKNITIRKITQFMTLIYMLRRSKSTDKVDSEGLKSHNKFTHLTREPATIKEDNETTIFRHKTEISRDGHPYKD